MCYWLKINRRARCQNATPGRGNLLYFQEIVLDQIVIVRCVHRITTILMIVIRMMILVVPVMEMIRIQMLIPDCNEKRLCLFSFVHYLNCHNNVWKWLFLAQFIANELTTFEKRRMFPVDLFWLKISRRACIQILKYCLTFDFKIIVKG